MHGVVTARIAERLSGILVIGLQFYSETEYMDAILIDFENNENYPFHKKGNNADRYGF